MNALTLQSRRLYKAGKSIGANTQNVTLNLHDKAVAILERVCGQNRSQFIRQAIAHEIQRIDSFAGLAFRAACRLSNEIKSIFTGTPSEKAAACVADVESDKSQAGNRTDLGGEKLIVESVEEFADESAFVKGGSK